MDEQDIAADETTFLRLVDRRGVDWAGALLKTRKKGRGRPDEYTSDAAITELLNVGLVMRLARCGPSTAVGMVAVTRSKNRRRYEQLTVAYGRKKEHIEAFLDTIMKPGDLPKDLSEPIFDFDELMKQRPDRRRKKSL